MTEPQHERTRSHCQWAREFLDLYNYWEQRHIRETAALMSDKCKHTDRLVEKLWFCSQAGFFKQLFISGSAQLWFLIRLRDKANLPRATKRFSNGKNSPKPPKTKTSGRSDPSNVSVSEKQPPPDRSHFLLLTEHKMYHSVSLSVTSALL